MTEIDKNKVPVGTAATTTGPESQTASEHGTAILKQLGPGLAKRGVPETSYVMVNLANGEFVTGKTKAETAQRFESMHPGAEGWMQLVGDVIGVSLAGHAGAEPDTDTETDDTPQPVAGSLRNPSTPRWNSRRGSTRN